MGSVAFMVSRLKSFKIIGRNRVQFHLDDLVMLRRQVDGRYFWLCRMAEVDPYQYGTGVACASHGTNINTQFLAEEAALDHIVNVHRGIGGERRPRHRGVERRAKDIARWNSRHGQFTNRETI